MTAEPKRQKNYVLHPKVDSRKWSAQGTGEILNLVRSVAKGDSDDLVLDHFVVDPPTPGESKEDGSVLSEEERRPLSDGFPLFSHKALRLLVGKNTEKIFRIPLAYSGLLTTTAGNILANLANNDPSVATNWASAAGLFNQYRVVKYECWVTPMYNVNAVGVQMQAMHSFLDEDDATTVPASYVTAMAHPDTLEVQSGYELLHRSFTPVYSASTNPDDTWNDTAAPATASNAIKFVVNTSLATTVTHIITVRWYVEFRGLGA